MAALVAPYIVHMVGRACGLSTLAWFVQGTVLMSDRTGRVDGRPSLRFSFRKRPGWGQAHTGPTSSTSSAENASVL